MRRLIAMTIGVLALTVTVGAPGAMAHGGDEMAISELKMQPASTLAQQALVEPKVNGDVEDAAVRLDAAEPGTGGQEVFCIIAGACLVLLGLLALRPWRKMPGASPLAR